MNKQNGSALIYILVAIALLAALTASFMRSPTQQASSQNIVTAVSDLKSQSDFIRSAIQECILIYPGGDQSTPGKILRNNPYPINPSSTYFTSPSDSENFVRDVRCPGNPGMTADHSRIFGVTTGKSLPPPPNLFEDWSYYSGVDGVFFYTRTSKSDAFLKTAVQRLDEEFALCEADIIDASSSSVNMTSEGSNGPSCASGSVCFRVWMIARPSASDAYQTGSAEKDANCP